MGGWKDKGMTEGVEIGNRYDIPNKVIGLAIEFSVATATSSTGCHAVVTTEKRGLDISEISFHQYGGRNRWLQFSKNVGLP
jgi:hypothetical protein